MPGIKSSWRDHLLSVQVFAWLAAASFFVHILPFSVLKRFLKRRRSPIFDTKPRPSVEQIARGVERTSRMVPGATCLAQALACAELMLRNGYEGLIRIGVRKDSNQKITAHAWVEYAGKQVIGTSRDVEFVTLF